MATTSDCELRPLPLEPKTCLSIKDENEKWHLLKKKAKSHVRLRSSICVQNKTALVILMWNFLLSLLLGVLLNPHIYLSLFIDENFVAVTCGAYGFTAILFLFFPIAGFLADVKFGRYKVVTTSLWLIWSCLIICVPLVGLGFLLYHFYAYLIWIPIAIGIVATAVMLIGFVGFNANVIQFGMDQLYDAPSDHSSLFIYWYVWGYYLAASISKPLWSGIFSAHCGITVLSVIVMVVISAIVIIILALSLCIGRCMKKWFVFDQGTRWNPYRLVYRVLKFAVKHKRPVCRSAFTYCEETLPSRIDFGKEKYGGPFSTEEVEDVKVFFGILIVLFALGPTFATEIATNALLPTFAGHLQNVSTIDCFSKLIIDNGTLTPLFITILIPVYLCLFPFLRSCIPGMMKRMGLGMIFFLLSLLSTFSMDTAGHIINNNATCFLSNDPRTGGDYLDINSHILILQSFLNSIGYMLLYVATYEFICAQSPHSMKGLLIGVFFAINGLFQLLSTLGLFLPFTFWRPQFPSCSFGYYLVIILISLGGLLIFIFVSKRYHRRERDEQSRIHMYAEEYYEKTQDEPNYDYDDYDNLNVETIRK